MQLLGCAYGFASLGAGMNCEVETCCGLYSRPSAHGASNGLAPQGHRHATFRGPFPVGPPTACTPALPREVARVAGRRRRLRRRRARARGWLRARRAGAARACCTGTVRSRGSSPTAATASSRRAARTRSRSGSPRPGVQHTHTHCPTPLHHGDLCSWPLSLTTSTLLSFTHLSSSQPSPSPPSFCLRLTDSQRLPSSGCSTRGCPSAPPCPAWAVCRRRASATPPAATRTTRTSSSRQDAAER